MPEASGAVQATGVNWDAVGYEVSFFALFALLMARRVRRVRLPLTSIEWPLLGRILLSVFVAALGAGVLARGDLYIPLALLRVTIFAAVIGQTLVTVRVLVTLRGRRP